LGVGGRFAEISSNSVPRKERTLRIMFYSSIFDNSKF